MGDVKKQGQGQEPEGSGASRLDREVLEQAPTEKKEPPTCLNCGAPLSATYCGECGQSHRRTRLDARGILEDLVDLLFNLDSSFWTTVRRLSVAPGQTALEYVRGRRRRYLNPLKYYLLAIAAQFALLELVLGYREMTPTIPSGLLGAVGSVPAEVVHELLATVIEMIQNQAKWFSAAFMPVSAIFFRLVFRRRGYNFAETLTLVAFVEGHVTLLLSIPISILTMVAQGAPATALGVLMVLVGFAYQCWAVARFFETGTIRSVAAVLGVIIVEDLAQVLVILAAVAIALTLA
jgi:hypothetical protein